MTRALLEQALNALEWHTQQTRPIHNTELAIDALQAELAKPAPTQPAWHDAPNAPGLWTAAYPQPTAVRIDDVQALDRVKAWPGNWFGPLPEDRK